jgi:hypothetical protein
VNRAFSFLKAPALAARECGVAFAAFKGDASPLRHAEAFAS